MSGLAGVLAGRHAPGVYRWHGNFDTADVRHTVEHAGWTYGHLDGWEIEHKAEFLAAIGDALAFPGHYGQNLDALADCLADGGQELGLVLDLPAVQVPVRPAGVLDRMSHVRGVEVAVPAIDAGGVPSSQDGGESAHLSILSKDE